MVVLPSNVPVGFQGEAARTTVGEKIFWMV
jgi:hypothetical protein